MSRLAQRRSSRALEFGAVAVVLAGLFFVEAVRTGAGAGIVTALANDPGVITALAIPAFIASLVAVVKLR